MVIKDNFKFNIGVSNLLNLTQDQTQNLLVENGFELAYSTLQILKKNIEHFTKDSVYKQISEEYRNEIAIIYYDKYPLHISYNIPTKQIIINLYPFNTDTITNMNPQPRNLYSCVAYGICFRNFIENKVKVKSIYFTPIENFLTTMFVQVFGRDYGLLGRYSSNINLLKFLTSVYVLIGFIGEEKNNSYLMAGKSASINFREISDELDSYDFSDIGNLIQSLSDFKVLPGITKYHFVKTMLKIGIPLNYLLSMEDFSRFISSCMVCSIPLSTLIPRFISTKYNVGEFSKILEISKLAFR